MEHRTMSPDELRLALANLGISQVDFARLINVTPRAISLYLGKEREIPGAVEAYIRLLGSLPMGQRQAELTRMNIGVRTMKDGMYKIDYVGKSGSGYATLIFEGGRIFGADVAHGQYDGHYEVNSRTGLVDISVRVMMPANTPSVIGIVQPFDWMLDVKASMNPARDSDNIQVTNNLGAPLAARYEFLRSLPNH
jgi:hypothetical protein